jgi:hypothetical protein
MNGSGKRNKSSSPTKGYQGRDLLVLDKPFGYAIVTPVERLRQLQSGLLHTSAIETPLEVG